MTREWIEAAREGKGVSGREKKERQTDKQTDRQTDRQTETERQRQRDSKRQRDNIKIMQNLFYPLAYQSHAPRFIQEIYKYALDLLERKHDASSSTEFTGGKQNTHTHTHTLSLSLSLSLVKMALYT